MSGQGNVSKQPFATRVSAWVGCFWCTAFSWSPTMSSFTNWWFSPHLVFPGEISSPCYCRMLKEKGLASTFGKVPHTGRSRIFGCIQSYFSLRIKMKLEKYKPSLMSSEGAGSVFLWDICQCILLPHLRASRFHLSKAFIKFTNSFHAGSSVSRCGWAEAADPLCTQTGPQGSGFLTSPVGWELRNANHLQVICKHHFLLIIFLYEPDWNQVSCSLKVIKGNFLSNLADTAAVHPEPPCSPKPQHCHTGTARDQTCHCKHSLQLFLCRKGKKTGLVSEVFIKASIQKFTPAYLFSDMRLCVEIWPVKMHLCAWHVFNVICLQLSLNISKIRFMQEHCLPPFSKDLKRALRSVWLCLV